MTVYAKLQGSQPPLSCVYKDNTGTKQYVFIPNDGAWHAIDEAVTQLPNFATTWTGGGVHVSSSNTGSPLITAGTVLSDSTPAAAATTSAAGVVKQAAHQANSTASDVPTLLADFNSLLGKLQTAGLMA